MYFGMRYVHVQATTYRLWHDPMLGTREVGHKKERVVQGVSEWMASYIENDPNAIWGGVLEDMIVTLFRQIGTVEHTKWEAWVER